MQHVPAFMNRLQGKKKHLLVTKHDVVGFYDRLMQSMCDVCFQTHKIPRMSCKVNMTSCSKTLLKFWSGGKRFGVTNVRVMLLPSPSQHLWLPETCHAHGRVAMNASTELSVKTTEQPMDLGSMLRRGDVFLSAVSTSSVPGHTFNPFFKICIWKKKQNKTKKPKENILQSCSYSNPTLDCTWNILHGNSSDWMPI